MSLDPVSNRVNMCSADDLGVSAVDADASVNDSDRKPFLWPIQVARTTTVDPGHASRVRCRLLHPTSKEPILASRQFIAAIDGMSFAFESSDNGAFSPHLPNADVVGKTFERGDIIGYADSLSAFVFPTNSEAVAAVEATTPIPRKHSQEEKRIISDKLYTQVKESCLSAPNKRKLHDLLTVSYTHLTLPTIYSV